MTFTKRSLNITAKITQLKRKMSVTIQLSSDLTCRIFLFFSAFIFHNKRDFNTVLVRTNIIKFTLLISEVK